MEDQEFINQLAEKLIKLGTVRPLGFHYLHPYGTVPADSIICNGATYSRALYKDFFDYITTQGWVKTEAEWQEIAARDNGFCPFYSDGDGSTNFRTPKFAPYQKSAREVAQATQYHQVGIPNVERDFAENSYAYKDGASASGAFKVADLHSTGTVVNAVSTFPKAIIRFDAPLYDAHYGRSSTVTPDSHKWVMCVVAYGVATNVGSADIQNVMSAVNAVQASIADIESKLSGAVRFAAPWYAAGATLAANKRITIPDHGFIRYHICLMGTGGKVKHITINDTTLSVRADDYSSDMGILPVIKGDTVKHDGVDEVVFYPARLAS